MSTQTAGREPKPSCSNCKFGDRVTERDFVFKTNPQVEPHMRVCKNKESRSYGWMVHMDYTCKEHKDRR